MAALVWVSSSIALAADERPATVFRGFATAGRAVAGGGEATMAAGGYVDVCARLEVRKG